MFGRLRNAYDVLIGSLLDYAHTIRAIDRQARDLHGLDAPTGPAIPTPPALAPADAAEAEPLATNGHGDRPPDGASRRSHPHGRTSRARTPYPTLAPEKIMSNETHADAAARSPLNLGLRRLVALLGRAEQQADALVDAGHGGDCRCAFCLRSPGYVLRSLLHELEGVSSVAHVYGSVLESQVLGLLLRPPVPPAGAGDANALLRRVVALLREAEGAMAEYARRHPADCECPACEANEDADGTLDQLAHYRWQVEGTASFLRGVIVPESAADEPEDELEGDADEPHVV